MKTARVLLPLLLLMTVAAVAQQHPNIERGFLPDKTYQVGDVDAVNLFNGTLNLSIPIGLRYPVNASLGYQFQLSYATNTWDVEQYDVIEYDQTPPYTHHYYYHYTQPPEMANAGFGWVLTLGAIFTDKDGLVYMSPDGARHRFAGTLHNNDIGEVADGTTFYTRDGSYLRLKKISPEWELEFPNGDKHKFEFIGSQLRLKTVADTFGNTITIAYGTRPSGPFAGSSMWTVTDSTGPSREHHVYFRPSTIWADNISTQGRMDEVVDYLDLAGFNGSRSEYHLQYATDGAAGQPDSLLVSRRCTSTEPPVQSLNDAVRVPVLQSITMPVGSPYQMTYDLGYDPPASPNPCSSIDFNDNGHASGNLTSLVLPTGATIHYKYGMYFYPGSGDWQPPSDLGGDYLPTVYFSTVPGVKSRIVKDRDGSKVLSENEYVPETNTPFPHLAQYRLLRRKNGTAIVSEERHYFSTCVNLACSNHREYALPLTRKDMPTNGPFLSTETYLPNASGVLELKRSTWVIYEGDGDLNAPAPIPYEGDLNRRVRYAKTIFEDGKYSEATYSNFDGLGHYRQTVTNGDIAPGNNQRTVFTNFNPARGEFIVIGNSAGGDFTMPPVGAKWILNTFDVERATENGQTSQTLSCFDANGFLTSRRTYASFGTDPPPLAKDLLAIYTPDASSGNMEYEQYLGGDTEQPPDGPAGVPAPVTTGCVNSHATETYRIGHKYDKGVRKASFFVGINGLPMTPLIADLEIDANTGLPSSRSEFSTPDASGVSFNDGLKTVLVYDAFGRVTEETPQGGLRGARRRNVFGPNLATVQVREETSGGVLLRERNLELDGLGRLTKDTRAMPNGMTASRHWEHDAVGRITAASFWGTGPPLFTRFEYDGFSRPTKQTSPDGAVTTFGYTGISSSTTTSQVRTDGTDSTLIQSPATTTMAYDSQGRVRSVTEPGGIVTRYTYDVAGRLTNVCGHEAAGCTQQRVFTYDNRGFLTDEQTPELGAQGNGTASYRYDARGNVVRRIIGPTNGNFDVWMKYDREGRLDHVYEARTTGGVHRTLKLFTYATSNSGFDYRNGRVYQATRYNWFEGYNWQIVETYVYSGRDGRVSLRDTYDNECIGSVSTCNPWGNVGTGTQWKRWFRQRFEHDELGSVTSLDYPWCYYGACMTANIPLRNVSKQYDRGWLASVDWTAAAQPSQINYHLNGMVSEVVHGNQVIDKTELDDMVPMPRPYRITTTNVLDGALTCVVPSFSVQPESQTTTLQSPQATLSAVATGQTGMQIRYQWYVGAYPDASTPVGPITLTGQLQVSPAVTTHYWVEASNDCPNSQVASETATITVCAPPSITANGHPTGTTITSGQEITLTVGATGSATLSYQWYTVSGATSNPVNGAISASLPVSPTATTQYRARVQNGCGEVWSNAATITVLAPPTAPTLVAASFNGSQNTVTWAASSSAAGIARYEVHRVNGPTWTITMPAVLMKVDGPSGLVNATAYRYQVRAVDNNGIASAWSAQDFTVTMAYTDNSLQAGATYVKGIHIAQLRQAIDAVRGAAGLPLAWSGYASPTDYLLAAHITEMRQKLNEARVALGLPAMFYTDPLVTPGDSFVAINILQLRSAAN